MEKIGLRDIVVLQDEWTDDERVFDRFSYMSPPRSAQLESYQLDNLKFQTKFDMLSKKLDKPYVFKGVLTKFGFLPFHSNSQRKFN